VGGTTAVAVGSGTGVSSGNGVEVGAVVGVGASVGTSVGAVANVGVGVGGGVSSGVAVGSSTTTDPGSEVGIWVGCDGVGSGVGVAATATPCHRRRNQMRRLPLESGLLSTGLQRPGNCPLSVVRAIRIYPVWVGGEPFGIRPLHLCRWISLPDPQTPRICPRAGIGWLLGNGSRFPIHTR